MSNPYTKPSIANYNANPPPDDGSTGADNEITWAKHKAKLTDPIKDLADAISNNVFSAFGKRAFNDVSSISSSYTVLAADEGKLLSCSNTITITLPVAASAGTGFMVSVMNSGTGTVTVDGDGAETINGGATLSLYENQAVVLVGDGSGWHSATTYLGFNPGSLAPKDTVGTADIDDAAVTEAKLSSGAVTAVKLSDYPWGWEDFQDVAAGNYIYADQTYKTSGMTNSTYTKVCEIKVPFAGTVTTRMYIVGNGSTKNMNGTIYVNGVAVGTERNTTTTGYFNENITVAAGDLVQLYALMQDGIASAGAPQLAVMTDGAMAGGPLYTLSPGWS